MSFGGLGPAASADLDGFIDGFGRDGFGRAPRREKKKRSLTSIPTDRHPPNTSAAHPNSSAVRASVHSQGQGYDGDSDSSDSSSDEQGPRAPRSRASAPWPAAFERVPAWARARRDEPDYLLTENYLEIDTSLGVFQFDVVRPFEGYAGRLVSCRARAC